MLVVVNGYISSAKTLTVFCSARTASESSHASLMRRSAAFSAAAVDACIDCIDCSVFAFSTVAAKLQRRLRGLRSPHLAKVFGEPSC